MKATKFILASIFALFLIVGVASALSFGSPSNDLTLSRNATITLSNNDGVNQSVTLNSPVFSDGTNSVTLSVSPQTFALNSSSQETVSLKLSGVPSTFKFGKYTTILNATSNQSNLSTSSSIVFNKGFCTAGSVGTNLTINNVDISNSGDEDETWMPLNVVKIEVEVENVGDNDVDDVVIKLALYDSAGKNSVNDLDFINADEEEIEVGRIRDGDEEVATFEFKVPADFDTGSYKLAVKAFSQDVGESNLCTDTSSDLDNNLYQQIDIDSEDDEGKFIAFDNIELSSEQAVCGDPVTLTFDAFNVGDNDEDQVKVIVSNSQLGINMVQEIKSGLDKGDGRELSFTFTVPSTAQNKAYNLELSAEYDYRSGVYREKLDEVTPVALQVIGCGAVTQTLPVLLVPSLTSEAEAGEQLTATIVLTNTASTQQQVIVDIKDYENWASLSSISDRIVSLSAGESKTVSLTFDIKEDASGPQSFRVESRSGDVIDSKTVQVSVADNGKVFDFGGSNLIWVIAIVNIVLIILIIVIAIRVSRR